MNIIEKTYTLNGTLNKRNSTERIILHHAAASNCTTDQIDGWHKGKGWTCIGYHFFVNKEGEIYRGRPEDTIGAHASNSNSNSIGICAEGNFENETMGDIQKNALKELVAYLKNKYGISKVQKHRDVNSTACPGANYPFDEIANATVVSEPISDSKIEYKERVKELQTLLGGLDVDGIYGVKSKAATTNAKIKKGKAGNVVKFIQLQLNRYGYGLTADGIFGALTEKATIAFQKSKGLAQDGWIGGNTMEQLLK